MTGVDIIKQVHKVTEDTDNVLHIIDEINSFMLDYMPALQWVFTYDITITYTGTAVATQAVLSDTTATFATDGTLVGQTINNSTDGSSGTITANTATTITATLTGGTNNTWTSADVYSLVLANDIAIPKTINSISGVFVDASKIYCTLPASAEKNTAGDQIDPYSQTSRTQQSGVQAGVLTDDYKLRFVVDITGTTLQLFCSKMADELAFSDITAETVMDLPNKFIPAISNYVLSKLFMYKEYRDYDLAKFYDRAFEKSYKRAKKPLGSEASWRLNLGKDDNAYNFQDHKTI